jgi:hypothetical protein
MRLIETEMLEAINEGRDWSKDNTSVHITCRNEGRYWAEVRLHGHTIADIRCVNKKDTRRTWTYPETTTLQQWPTRTTMSRLRALGVDVCTRKGEVLLNGKVLADDKPEADEDKLGSYETIAHLERNHQ